MKIILDDGGFIEIPFSVDEIEFGRFCDFKQKEAEFIEQLKTGDDVQASAPLLIEAVETIIKGDIVKLPYSIDNESVIDLMDNGFMFNFEDEISIVRIYVHIINLLRKFDPSVITKEKDLTIRFEGKTYFLSSQRAVRLMTETNVKVGEMLETLEFQRRFLVAKETATPNDIANLDFELGLYEVAILMREDGESLPHKKAEFDVWIETRIRVVEKIPLSDVLRVRFFLLNCLIDYTKTGSSDTFGKDARIFIPKPKKANTKRR